MTKTQNNLLFVIMAGAMVVATFYFALWVVNSTQKALGGAGEVQGAAISATTTVVGPVGTGLNATAITIFGANRSCSSRIISTRGTNDVAAGTGAILILFHDFTDLDGGQFNSLASSSFDGLLGHVQAASTTVAYDASLYGCGRWTANASASTTITTTEIR